MEVEKGIVLPTSSTYVAVKRRWDFISRNFNFSYLIFSHACNDILYNNRDFVLRFAEMNLLSFNPYAKNIVRLWERGSPRNAKKLMDLECVMKVGAAFFKEDERKMNKYW